MTKKMKFEKKDKTWELCDFYKIYMKDNVKMIKFLSGMSREPREKNYLSWVAILYPETCEMPLKDFVEWDAYFQLEKMMKNCVVSSYECNPEVAFNFVNRKIKGDGNGSCFKMLLKLTEDTPCGYYYGY